MMTVVKNDEREYGGAWADPPVLEDVAGACAMKLGIAWQSGREWAETMVAAVAGCLVAPDEGKVPLDVERTDAIELADSTRLAVGDIIFRLARPVEELVRRNAWDGTAEDIRDGLLRILKDYVDTYGMPERPRLQR